VIKVSRQFRVLSWNVDHVGCSRSLLSDKSECCPTWCCFCCVVVGDWVVLVDADKLATSCWKLGFLRVKWWSEW
jgi:hypothetical protein